MLQLPLLAVLCKGKVRLPEKLRGAQPSKKLFVSGSVFLAVLTGLLIPSAVIHASPQEFVNMTSFLHPAWYIVAPLLCCGHVRHLVRLFTVLPSPR